MNDTPDTHAPQEPPPATPRTLHETYCIDKDGGMSVQMLPLPETPRTDKAEREGSYRDMREMERELAQAKERDARPRTDNDVLRGKLDAAIRNAGHETALRLDSDGRALREERQWQPIESAPKDGTEVLLFARGDRGEGYTLPGYYANRRWQWVCYTSPTHWMKLPTPPKP